MTFIVQSKGARASCDTVVAPTGYSRTRDGGIIRDGTPSPEMGPIQHAYHFASHMAAARVASKLAFPIIREMPDWQMAAEMKRKHDDGGDIEGRLCNPEI